MHRTGATVNKRRVAFTAAIVAVVIVVAVFAIVRVESWVGGGQTASGAQATAPVSAAATPTTGSPARPVDHGPRASATGTSVPQQDGTFLYTIAKGDTLGAIAYRFGICNVDVFSANRQFDGHPDLLEPGQTITIEVEAGGLHGPADCHTAVY